MKPAVTESQKEISQPINLEKIVSQLFDYCKKLNWAGYDPYDALNSRLFMALPFLNFRLARLALTQGVKRCPVNLRPILFVPKSSSSKCIALFLSAFSRLARCGWAEAESLIAPMADKLLSLRSPGLDLPGWGYNFDWQQRFTLIPKDSPNIICTTFSAKALIEAYEQKAENGWIEAAVGAADFILGNLFRKEGENKAHFCYTLIARDEVHNANLLGAAFLSRVARLTGEKRYMEAALAAARWSVKCQHKDGSWAYGEAPTQQWIDNFHTGFNLIALKELREQARTDEFDQALHHGFDFYKARFFRKDGAPRYYHNATYPIDIHGVSQSLITLTEFRWAGEDNGDLRRSVLSWALRNMRDHRGFFYFQKRPHVTVRISFMRWSQAWMLLALSTLLSNGGLNGK